MPKIDAKPNLPCSTTASCNAPDGRANTSSSDDNDTSMSAKPIPGPAYFDAMFQASADPWKYKERWYEERKRALTLACLPQRRYASGYEPGCANGELSAALAGRCDRLLISDGTAAAAEL